MASRIDEFLRKFRGGGLQEQNILRGEVIPLNRFSGRITERDLPITPGPVRIGKLPGRDITTTPINELTSDELAKFDSTFAEGFPSTPGRGLEPRFRPTGRQRSITELLAEGRQPEVLPDTGQEPGRGFDWSKFIEVTGRLGAALAPEGTFARAGLAAAGLVKEERERGAKAAAGVEDTRRFEIETRLKEVDDALNQAKFDWQQTQDTGTLEKAIKLEQEKNRLRIELEEAKQPAREVKAKVVTDKAERTRQQQVKNRIRTAKNSVMSAIRRHDIAEVPQLRGFEEEQIIRIMEIVREMDITGDETTDAIIQRAVDIFKEEGGLETKATKQIREIINIQQNEISASELLGPDEESTDFITDEELLRR